MREMVRPTGFEPMAPRLGIWCSILLSYGRPMRALGGEAPSRNCPEGIGLLRTSQLSSSGGATGNGSGITAMPSSSSSFASPSVAWPWIVSASVSP